MADESAAEFMIFDLTKLVPGRGLPLSACPYYVATDGHPNMGTATGAPGERLFVFGCAEAEHEDEVFLEGLFLNDSCKLFFRVGDTPWGELGEWGHNGYYDFKDTKPTGDSCDQFTAMKVVGSDFRGNWAEFPDWL